MKKLLLPFLFLYMISGLNAREGVMFRIKYLPEHVYEVTTNTQMLMVMTMESGEGFPHGEGGIPEGPMRMQMDHLVKGIINTGKPEEDGAIPLQMHLNQQIKMTAPFAGMVDQPQAESIQFSMGGFADSNGVIQIETVDGAGIPDEAIESVKELISNLSAQVQFPDHPMKIGDSFTQQIPFNIPMEGMGSMVMFIVADYSLVSMEGHLAMFDVVQTLEMDASEGGFSLIASGEGGGTLTLDTRLEYVTASSILFNLEMLLDMGMMKMTNSMESEIIQTVDIRKL
jgi:hypothetical protein